MMPSDSHQTAALCTSRSAPLEAGRGVEEGGCCLLLELVQQLALSRTAPLWWCGKVSVGSCLDHDRYFKRLDVKDRIFWGLSYVMADSLSIV
jgi:hypothetical protein